RGQVEGEGARHLRRRVRARSRAGELGAGRKRAGDAPEERFPARVVGDDEVDAREPAGRVEHLLGGGDVGDEQRVERASGERVGRLDEPHEPDLAPASPQSQGEGIAGSEAERRRGCARDEGGARPRHEIGEGVGGRAPAESLTARRQVWPEGLLREWIDAEEMKGAPGEVSGRSIPLDDGRRASGPEPHAEVAVYGLGQPRRPAHDLMRGAAGDGLGGEVEGAPRAVVGEMDGHGHGDAEGDAEHGEPDLPRMPQQVTEARAPEEATHDGAADEGSTSCPCWTVKTRSATPTTSRLCVTMTTVLPCSRTSPSNRLRTWAAVSASRLPVGSSARTSGGSWASARAMASRCCSPPESRSG